ncbi:MAG: c-type cytochrome [Thermodesulfobacteriota bacterium]
MRVRSSTYILVLSFLTLLFIPGVCKTYAQKNPHDMDTLGKEQFIENRCVRCHTIGRGRFVGPDLEGVGQKYTRDQLVKWIENPQQVYQTTGKMPMNEGYPPMPPMDVHPMAAQAIADYILKIKVKPDTGKGGTITGKVSNKTENIPLSGVKIILTSYMGDKATDTKNSETSKDGNFSFHALPWDRSYVVTIEYNGAQYSTEKMVFYPDEDTKTLDLPVYDPTTSAENISVTEGHMIIQISEDGLSIADLSVFQNKGDRMYVGSAEIADGKKETLKFNVPSYAANLNFMQGLDPESIVKTSTGFSDISSVPPGSKRIAFAYTLPFSSGSGSVEKTIEYPTESFLLLISKSNDSVTVDGLTGGDTVHIEKEEFLRWSGENLKPGHKIVVKFVNPTAWKDYIKWGVIGFLVLIIGGGIIYSSLSRGGSRETAVEEKKNVMREELLKRRSYLIKEIAALDDGYEAGRIEESSYKEIREAKKAELVEVTRRLRL